MEIEKRAYRRLEIQLDVVCKDAETQHVLKDIYIVNIDHQGIGFISQLKHECGEHLNMTVTLDEGQAVDVKCEVVWCEPIVGQEGYKVGVKIIDTKEEDLERFQKFYSLKLLYPPNDP